MRIVKRLWDNLVVIAIAQIIVFVYSLVFGILFWAVYSVWDALLFAVCMTVFSFVFSGPAFLLADYQFKRVNYDMLMNYLVAGAICGIVIVFVGGVFGLAGRIFSRGMPTQVLSPVDAAWAAGAASIIVGAVLALQEHRRSRRINAYDHIPAQA